MAPHPRKLIRDAAAAKIVAFDAASLTPLFSGRIYKTREIPQAQLELPAVAVYTESESSDRFGPSTSTLRRELTLVVEVAVAVTDTIDDALDAACAQIECALGQDDSLNNTVDQIVLTGTEVDIAPLGNKLIGIAKLTFSAVYYADVPDADCAAATYPFTSADIHYSLNGTQATADQHEDIITISQE